METHTYKGSRVRTVYIGGRNSKSVKQGEEEEEEEEEKIQRRRTEDGEALLFKHHAPHLSTTFARGARFTFGICHRFPCLFIHFC